jgi:hypothetical protein
LNTKKKKKRKYKAGSKATHDAIRYQVSIRGPKVSKLDNKSAGEVAINHLNGNQTLPYKVRIKVWRRGQELDWHQQSSLADESRAETLRANLRRALQQGRVKFRKVGNR